MSHDDDLIVLAMASDRLAGSLSSLTPEQWGQRTPCDEWDVQALVDHVVGGNWFTNGILDGLTAENAMVETMARFGGCGATIEQALASVADQQAAFRRPGVLEQTWHHVAGDLTGRQIIRLRLHDLIAHTWDLDESVHRNSSIPERLVRWGLDELTEPDSLALARFGSAEADRSDETAAAYLRSLGRSIS